MRECLTGVGHTFLHSWTHFLAFMEWADDGGSGLLHGAALLSNLPLVLFVFFIGPQQLIVAMDTGFTPPDYPRPGAVVLSLSCVRRGIARPEASRTSPSITCSTPGHQQLPGGSPSVCRLASTSSHPPGGPCLIVWQSSHQPN